MLVLKRLEKQVLRNAVATNYLRSPVLNRSFHPTLNYNNEISTQVDTKPIKPVISNQGKDEADKSKREDSNDASFFTPVKFSDLKGKGFINNAILTALHKAKFESLTPIQQKH